MSDEPALRSPSTNRVARAVGVLVLLSSAFACTLVSGWNDLRDGDTASADAATTDATLVDAATTDAPTGNLDGGPDAARTCVWNAPFTIVQMLPATVNEPGGRSNYASLSEDETTLYFQKFSGNTLGLYRATRPSKGEPFGNAVPIRSSSLPHANPSLSVDGSRLAFSVDATNSGRYEVRVARVSANGTVDFDNATTPLPVQGTPGQAAFFYAPHFSADGALWHTRVEETDTASVYRATLLPDGGTASVLFEPNARTSLVTRDLKTLYLLRNGVLNRGHRDNTAAAFSGFLPVPDLKITGRGVSIATWIAADECTLYFGAGDADPNAPSEIYVARRTPP